MLQVLAALLILTSSVIIHYALDEIHQREYRIHEEKLRLHDDELMRMKCRFMGFGKAKMPKLRATRDLSPTFDPNKRRRTNSDPTRNKVAPKYYISWPVKSGNSKK